MILIKKAEEISEYRKVLGSLKEQLVKEIEEAPAGRLRISEKGNRVEYYYCKEGVGTAGINGSYRKKKEEELIKRLAQKDYDSKLLREVLTQINKLERYPKNMGVARLEEVFDDLTESRKKLVIPKIKPTSLKIAEWEAIPFTPLGFGPDDPEYYTEKKERVRSKSEKFIADKLFHMGIPYKYECPINLAGYGTVYPDFTILNKHTMEIVWLEHCGRMGDAEYTAKMVAKVRSYEKSGIYVGRNLYLTFETLETPFDAGSIEAIFEKFA